VRAYIPPLVAVVWNVPLLAVMVALFRGDISERTMGRAMAAWALTIPLACVALIYVPWLQRRVFVAGVDMAAQRRKLWSLAALWLVILAIWLALDLVC
jgi:hypothetical protein